jgi:YggT family protein
VTNPEQPGQPEGAAPAQSVGTPGTDDPAAPGVEPPMAPEIGAAPPQAPAPAAAPIETRVVPPAMPPAAPPIPAPQAAMQPAPTRKRGRGFVGILISLVTLLFGVLQALLIMRIVLLVVIANQDDSIVSWILSVTEPFIEPFRGMFQLDVVTNDRGSVLDVAAIVALIAWTLIETLIVSVLRVFRRRS